MRCAGWLPKRSSLGVTLAVEATSHPGALLFGLSRVHRLLSYEGLDSLSVLFDTAHFHIRGEDVPVAYRTLNHRIAHVHVKDAKGQPEDYECPPLGMGDVDLTGFLAAVEAVGYEGFLCVEDEAAGWGYRVDPRQALVDAKACLERAWSASRDGTP